MRRFHNPRYALESLERRLNPSAIIPVPVAAQVYTLADDSSTDDSPDNLSTPPTPPTTPDPTSPDPTSPDPTSPDPTNPGGSGLPDLTAPTATTST